MSANPRVQPLVLSEVLDNDQRTQELYIRTCLRRDKLGT